MISTSPIDLSAVELVVFDVDGTLYDQSQLRKTMLIELGLACALKGAFQTALVLRTFRNIREHLGDEGGDGFLERQYALTADAHRLSPDLVRAVVDEWIERRPLRHLGGCVYAGVSDLFEGLRRRGIKIGVFSDYPAQAKLTAMGLQADLVRCATDPGVERLKPHPDGLLHIMRYAGVDASRTLMIGDRVDRDAEAARRAGVRALIRSKAPIPGVETFRRFDDAPFSALAA